MASIHKVHHLSEVSGTMLHFHNKQMCRRQLLSTDEFGVQQGPFLMWLHKIETRLNKAGYLNAELNQHALWHM